MRTCVCPYGRKAKYVLLLFKHAEEQVHAVGDVLTSASLVRTIKGSANAWSSAACCTSLPKLPNNVGLQAMLGSFGRLVQRAAELHADTSS